MQREIILISTLMLLILAPIVGASVSLGVSPGGLDFREVLKGGYARRVITVSTSKSEPVLTRITLEGEIADWITFEPNTTEFYISEDKPYNIGVIVQPPENIENGNYSGVMHVRTEKLGSLGGAAFGAIIKADVTVNINVEITGQEILSCYVGGLDVRDAEEGYPIEVYASVANDGNVGITPLFEVYVWDQMRTTLLLTRTIEERRILPTTKERLLLTIPNSLKPGQYWISVRVPECRFSQLKTFDVLEPGGISDKGELVGINTKPWVSVGEVVPIIGVFKNTGNRSEEVKLKIEIYKDKQLVKVLETETLRVMDGETREFKQYFIPKVAGRYEVRGVAFYNKKVTFEKGGVINVKPELKPKPDYTLWAAYAIMLFLIIVLARKIYRERAK
ncbi:hypothetical protein DRJ48_03415 [Candidatus Woesearchaeota archaeon]|nr:MAG: hypothetical protein DRJ48_03415 [Candidatus Woesearchaeota archaeon]